MTRRRGCPAWIAAVMTAGFAVHADAAQVTPRTRSALRDAPRVNVLIALRLPESGARSTHALRRSVRDARRQALAGLDDAEFAPLVEYRALPAVYGAVTTEGLARLESRPEVVAIDLDEPIRATLADTVPQIEADDLRRLHAITGDGVTVAVIDSGIDSDHPDLAGALVGERCFCPAGFFVDACCPNGTGSQSGPGSAEDDNGHGTGVSGIITSDGVVASRGAAPGARIYAIKVLNAAGGGTMSGLLSALDHLVADEVDARVVNLSLGGTTTYPSACDDESSITRTLAAAVETLAARGTIVVTSSGNDGTVGGMSYPGCIRGVVAVGAVSKTDGVLSFSDVSEMLDMLAPGGSVRAPWRGGGTTIGSGTSFAAPHVAATAAAVIEARPTITVAELQRLLRASGAPLLDTRFGRRFARVNAHDAYHQLSCGNGTVDSGEQCDDGDEDDEDGCTRDCRRCGNGTVTWPETCDDGGLVGGDGCDAHCQPSGCGNGSVAGAEECDDGNRSDFDGCSSACRIEPPAYLCYQATRRGDRFEPFQTTLRDALGLLRHKVSSPEAFCLPADVDGHAPAALAEPTHLRRYRLKPVSGEPRFTPIAGLVHRHRLNRDTSSSFRETLTLTAPALVTAASAMGVIAAPPPLAPPVRLPTYSCYRAKDTRRSRYANVVVQDAIGTLQLDLLSVRSVCLPADPDGDDPGTESEPTRLLCYKVRIAAGTPRFAPVSPVYVRSALATETLELRKPVEVCLPAIADD